MVVGRSNLFQQRIELFSFSGEKNQTNEQRKKKFLSRKELQYNEIMNYLCFLAMLLFVYRISLIFDLFSCSNPFFNLFFLVGCNFASFLSFVPLFRLLKISIFCCVPISIHTVEDCFQSALFFPALSTFLLHFQQIAPSLRLSSYAYLSPDRDLVAYCIVHCHCRLWVCLTFS